MSEVTVDSFLEHYGVKGMRWGVRKKEDSTSTPAKSKEPRQNARTKRRRAEREAEAKSYDKEAKELAVQISALKGSTKPGDVKEMQWLQARHDKAVANAEAARGDGLSPRQKKIIKGAAIAAGALAVYGGYRMVQSGQLNASIMQGKAFIQQRGDMPFKRRDILANPDLTPNQIESLVVSHINPDYSALGAQMNCRRCTFAYELRRRGYDVAATRTTTGFGQTAIGLHNATDTTGKNLPSGNLRYRLIKEEFAKQRASRWQTVDTPFQDVVNNLGMGKTKITERYMTDTSDSIFDALSREPNGARGELGMLWAGGAGGHSMAWEIIGGKPYIFDTQRQKRYTAESREWREKILHNIADASYTRLDNIELDTQFLLRWVKDAA